MALAHMPKMTSEHEDTIQFRLPEADKRAFQEAAAKMRVSLSAWLRIAGLEKIERDADAGPKRKPSASSRK